MFAVQRAQFEQCLNLRRTNSSGLVEYPLNQARQSRVRLLCLRSTRLFHMKQLLQQTSLAPAMLVLRVTRRVRKHVLTDAKKIQLQSPFVRNRIDLMKVVDELEY